MGRDLNKREDTKNQPILDKVRENFVDLFLSLLVITLGVLYVVFMGN